LLDGGPLWVYYPGLQAALGQTIGQALANAAGENLTPRSQDFSHVTWDQIDLDRLSTPIAFFLNISPRSTIKLLNGIQHLSAHWHNRDSQTKQFWLVMVKILIGEGTNHTTNNHLSVQYHRNHHQLSGSISPESLVEVLLYERPLASHNKAWVLSQTLLRSYLNRTFQHSLRLGNKPNLFV
jgi:hypothetical protein